jgi:chlorobactene glucosyltransferase
VFASLTVSLLATSASFLYQFAIFPALPRQAVPLAEEPSVSIVVPVRDEAHTVERCIASLKALNYPNTQIIFVDGNSTDGTRDVLQRHSDDVQVMDEGDLPKGWVGKNWACHRGFQQSRGEFVLFTDGDTIHSPESLKSSVNYLMNNEVDLLTVYPRLVMRGFWEKLMMPTIAHAIFLSSGGAAVNDDSKHRWFANGQYLLFRRSAYERIGGHEAVKSRVEEDYRLAERIKEAGLRLRVLSAPWALKTRMYSSLEELWEGWVKNSFAVMGDKPFKSLAEILYIFVFLLLPHLILLNGILSAPSEGVNSALVWGSIMNLILYGRIGGLYIGLKADLRYLPLFALSTILHMAILSESAARGLLGMKVKWKEREYLARPTGS